MTPVITRSQINAVCELLGVEPKTTLHLSIRPEEVVVTHYDPTQHEMRRMERIKVVDDDGE